MVAGLTQQGTSSDTASSLSPSATVHPSADSPSGKGGNSSRDSGCYASSEHLKKGPSRQHDRASPAGSAGPAKLVCREFIKVVVAVVVAVAMVMVVLSSSAFMGQPLCEHHSDQEPFVVRWADVVTVLSAKDQIMFIKVKSILS